jgi:hypothetical protein
MPLSFKHLNLNRLQRRRQLSGNSTKRGLGADELPLAGASAPA